MLDVLVKEIGDISLNVITKFLIYQKKIRFYFFGNGYKLMKLIFGEILHLNY